MRPGQLKPNELECAVLERIARDESWLKGPFDSLHVLSREYTGVGSFTDFECAVPKAADDPYPSLMSLIQMPGVANGMGAILWCRGTLPACLELYTYGGEGWDGTYDGFAIQESTDS